MRVCKYFVSLQTTVYTIPHYQARLQARTPVTMRVLTLHRAAFLGHCQRLEHLVADYDPDLVVAVARGGVYVAEHMFRQSHHVTVDCQRQTTAVKRRLHALFAVVRLLPLWLRNRLRMAEARRLSRKHTGQPASVTLDSEVTAAVQRARRVLVVDDAIDSGATMAGVLNAISAISGPDNKVRTAVITVTTRQPLVTPDYAIYGDGDVLVRFPWSEDMRREKL